MVNDSGQSRRRLPESAAWVLAASALCLVGCAQDAAVNDRPLVYVSIAPQAYCVERIAGGAVDVQVLMPPGADHLAYHPRPSQMLSLSRAALYVRIGLPFEDRIWPKIEALNPRMAVLDGREGIDAIASNHEHEGGGKDPHVWLDPANVIGQAMAICAALKVLVPHRDEEFENNASRLIADLEALDEELAARFAPMQGGGFWVYHPSWEYFADAYGLHQFSFEHQGKEPGARSLARLVDKARDEGIKTVFVEPGFGGTKAGVLAAEAGADTRVIDPFAKDYIDNLRAVGQRIAEAIT